MLNLDFRSTLEEERKFRKLIKSPSAQFGDAEKRLAPLLFYLVEDREVFTRFARKCHKLDSEECSQQQLADAMVNLVLKQEAAY